MAGDPARIRAAVAATRPQKVPTGIEGLDRILGGGLPKREIYLVQGDPGTGKTIFGLQFLLAGRDRGETGLFITLTQREADLEDTAASHGWSLEGLHIHQLSGATARGRVADQALFPAADIELTEIMAEVLEVVERVRPARVVFDAIAELRLLAADSTRFQHQIFALRDQFADSGATVIFLDTRPEVAATRELEHIAHGVILLDHCLTRFGNAQRRLRVLKMRGMGYSEGLHDCRIQTGGFVVFPRLLPGQESTREGEGDLLESGVEMLDRLVGGGLAEGSSCLFVGPSGVGKSSVSTLYTCEAARRGERSAVFLFEERPETFVRRSESLGMPVRSLIEGGLMIVRPVNTAELSPGEFAELVRQQVQERGVRVVTIDSLTGYISAMPDEQMLLTQMHDLLQYLSGQGVLTILVVAQHGIVGTGLGGPIDVSYLADAVLLFRHFEARGMIRRAISVFKKRYGDHEKLIRELLITPEGIQVDEPLRGFRGLLTGNPSALDEAVVQTRVGDAGAAP